MHAAEVDAHRLGLRRKLRVDVGQRPCVIGFRGSGGLLVVLGRYCRRRPVVRFLDGRGLGGRRRGLVHLFEQVLPVFRFAESQVDLLGFQLRRIGSGLQGRFGLLGRLRVEIEVIRQRRVIVEPHLLAGGGFLENLGRIDFAGLS